MKTRLLREILREVQRPGNMRAWIIGLIFPEIGVILSRLASLSEIVEKEEAQ